MFSKGDQLKIKLANLKFSETVDGRLFLVFGGRLVLGGRDFTEYYIYTYNISCVCGVGSLIPA